MDYSSTEMQLPQPMLNKARRAALLGTRTLITEMKYDALVAILVASGAVPAERASSMLTALSSTLRTVAANGHPEFQTHPGELRIQAERLAVRAAQIGAR